MPFINGRFYANPAYGAALERARAAEALEAREEFQSSDSANMPEIEELSERQAGTKHAPAQSHAHVPNSSYVTEYPHQRKIGGSASWRNNNPGSIMYTTKPHTIAQRYGAIGKDHLGRAIFPTMEAGEQAQDALWHDNRYQGKTIEDAAKTWSGSKDPVVQQNYINALSKAAGVPPNTPVSKLSPDQLERLKEAQRRKVSSRGLSSQRNRDMK